jgi:hypothetical protein
MILMPQTLLIRGPIDRTVAQVMAVAGDLRRLRALCERMGS